MKKKQIKIYYEYIDSDTIESFECFHCKKEFEMEILFNLSCSVDYVAGISKILATASCKHCKSPYKLYYYNNSIVTGLKPFEKKFKIKNGLLVTTTNGGYDEKTGKYNQIETIFTCNKVTTFDYDTVAIEPTNETKTKVYDYLSSSMQPKGANVLKCSDYRIILFKAACNIIDKLEIKKHLKSYTDELDIQFKDKETFAKTEKSDIIIYNQKKGGWKYYLIADANNISYSQYSYGFNNVYELCDIIDDCQLLARILCNIDNY
ncbi:MAG TPA: hypothetical protein PLK02_06925 [Paludibacteraceae bacterium]|nr:hypothetical protein [Paludibacteraceae bacterium]